jgi:hypothetical protein
MVLLLAQLLYQVLQHHLEAVEILMPQQILIDMF